MIKAKPKTINKNCASCGTYLGPSGYYPTKSIFFPDGYLTICKMCLEETIVPSDIRTMDRICQWADYAFAVDRWLPLVEREGKKAIHTYIDNYCLAGEYKENNWKEIERLWKDAIADGSAASKIPVLNEVQMAELRAFWGDGFEDAQLLSMDRDYQDLKRSFNLVTVPQRTSAINICKLSLRISEKISSNGDIDKDIKSYNELLKIGGFTAENSNNMSDFESVGEIYAYLEKTGWENEYYDGAVKDDVDATMNNSQAFNRRLVLGESNLREQVEQRLVNMGLGDSLEDGLSDSEFERYESEGLEEVLDSSISEEANEELEV